MPTSIFSFSSSSNDFKCNLLFCRVPIEHKLEKRNQHLAASDLSLTVIDMPGFNDTRGAEQDACNKRMSVEKFFQDHKSIKKGSLPNIVVVAIKVFFFNYCLMER